MQRKDEDENTGQRVTRSLRKRLYSVDRDSDASPPTGTPKKLTLNKLEAISEIGYNDNSVEQNDLESSDVVKSPQKNNKNDKSLSQDVDSIPMLRRRIKLSEEKETPKKLNVSKTKTNNLNATMPVKRTTRRNSGAESLDISLNALPARRITRRTSITSDDMLISMTPPVKHTRAKRLSIIHTDGPLKEEEEVKESVPSPKKNDKIVSAKEVMLKISPVKSEMKNEGSFGKSASPFEECFVNLVDVMKTKKVTKKSENNIKEEMNNSKDSVNEEARVSIQKDSNIIESYDALINETVETCLENIVKENDQIKQIKTPIRSTFLQAQKLFLSSTPNTVEMSKNEKRLSNSFNKNALSDSELIPTNNKTIEKHVEPSKSWLQSVKGVVSTNDDGIDTIVINKNKSLEENIIPLKKKNKSKSIIKSDEDSVDNNDEDIENEESKYEFIANEAKEMIDYSENDSMESEEQKYIEENEIPEDGLSIGSEDTTVDDVESEDSISSFIVDDEEEEINLLDDSGDDLSMDVSKNGKKNKRFSRICIVSSDDSDDNEKIKTTTASKKKSLNYIKGKSFDKKTYLNDNVESISSDDIEIINNSKVTPKKSLLNVADGNSFVTNTTSTNKDGIALNNKLPNDTIKFIDESDEEVEQDKSGHKIDSSIISQKSPMQIRVDNVNKNDESDEDAVLNNSELSNNKSGNIACHKQNSLNKSLNSPTNISDITEVNEENKDEVELETNDNIRNLSLLKSKKLDDSQNYEVMEEMESNNKESDNKEANEEDSKEENEVNKGKSFKEVKNNSIVTPNLNKSANRMPINEKNLIGEQSNSDEETEINKSKSIVTPKLGNRRMSIKQNIQTDDKSSSKEEPEINKSKSFKEDKNKSILTPELNKSRNRRMSIKQNIQTDDKSSSEEEPEINKSKSFKEDKNKSILTPELNKSGNRRMSIKQIIQTDDKSSSEEEPEFNKSKSFKEDKNKSILTPELNKSRNRRMSIKQNIQTDDKSSSEEEPEINKSKSFKEDKNKSILTPELNKSGNRRMSIKQIIQTDDKSSSEEEPEFNKSKSFKEDKNKSILTPELNKSGNRRMSIKQNIQTDDKSSSEEEPEFNKSKSTLTPELNKSGNRRLSIKEFNQVDDKYSSESEEVNLNSQSDDSNDDAPSSDDGTEQNNSIKGAPANPPSSIKKHNEALSISTILQKCETFLNEKESNKKILRQQLKLKKTDKKPRKRKNKKEETTENPIIDNIEKSYKIKPQSTSSSLEPLMKPTKKTTIAKQEEPPVLLGGKKRKAEETTSQSKIENLKKINKKLLPEKKTMNIIPINEDNKQNIASKIKKVDKVTKKKNEGLPEKLTGRTENYLPQNFLDALETESELVRKRKLSDKIKDTDDIKIKKPKNTYFLNGKDSIQKENRDQTIPKIIKSSSVDKLLFNEEPVTPDVAKRNCGFKISPVTPVRKDFKVESVKKIKKRNLLNVIEPRTVLPSTSWTRSGEFKVTEVKMNKEKTLNDSVYTDFIVSSLNPKKLNKNNKLQMVIDHANNAALKFKHEKLVKAKKLCTTTKQMLQSDVKGIINKKFR